MNAARLSMRHILPNYSVCIDGRRVALVLANKRLIPSTERKISISSRQNNSPAYGPGVGSAMGISSIRNLAWFASIISSIGRRIMWLSIMEADSDKRRNAFGF
jgi:hypothetical protein